MRFKYEAINRDVIDDHKDLTVYAMERYAYYVCCKCQKVSLERVNSSRNFVTNVLIGLLWRRSPMRC